MHLLAGETSAEARAKYPRELDIRPFLEFGHLPSDRDRPEAMFNIPPTMQRRASPHATSSSPTSAKCAAHDNSSRFQITFPTISRQVFDSRISTRSSRDPYDRLVINLAAISGCSVT